MRIISGEFRGRSIKTPSPKFTRPTTDRVKESLFNYLTNFLDFENIKVCDIYAGSGSLGLESLSRGAGKAHFVEKNFQVLNVLKQNISLCKAEERTRIFKMSAVKFSALSEHFTYDLIFADPPFFKDDIHIVVNQLLENNFLSSEGLLIIERSIQTKNNDIKNFGIEPFKQIGDSLIYQF